MDRRTIFTKTAKGLMEAKGQTSALPRDLRNILKEVDGRATVGQLSEELGKMPEAKLLEALAKMEREGYVRQFVTTEKAAGPPSQSPAPSGAEDLDFTSLTPKPAAKAGEYARRKTEAEEMASQASAARAAAEAAAKARAEAEAKAAAETKVRAEAEARARVLAEQKARAEAEARAAAEAKARAEAEARAKLAAEQKARLEAEAKAKAKAEADARARAEAEARAKREAEEKARREAEERARREAEERARVEAELKSRLEEERRAREESERRSKDEAQRLAREAEERARRETEEKVRREADELRAQLETERRARAEAERRAREEAERREREQAERRAREEAERKAKEESERKANEEADRLVRAAAERAEREAETLRAQIEAERKAREEAERVAREAEERARRESGEDARRAADALRLKQEAERKAQEEAERRAREEEERAAKAAAEARAKAQAEAKEREDAETRRREEEERRARDDAERRAKEEADARAKAEAEAKAREEAEARRREEEQRRAKENEERRAREDAERRAKEESDAKAKVEAEAKEREEAEARRREEEDERRAREREAEQAEKEAEKQEKEDSKARARQEADAAAQARKDARARERERAKDRKAEEREQRQQREEAEEAVEEPSRTVIPEPVTVAPTAKFRKPRNWARYISLGLFIVLIGALIAIHVIPIDVLPFEKAAQERFGEPVRIGAIRFSLMPRPHLSFERVTIGADPQLKIASISAVPEFGILFSPRKVLKSVEINGLVLPAAFASRVLWGKGGDDALRVERVIATKLKFEFSGMTLPPLDADAVFGPAGLEKAQLSNAQSGLSVTLQQDGDKTQIEIDAKQFALPFAEKITLDGFSGKGTLGPRELTLREAGVRAYDGLLSGNARLSWRDTLSFDGEFVARGMDAAKLAAPVLSGGRLEGRGVYGMRGSDSEKLMASARLEGSFSVQKGTLGNIDLTRLLQGGSGSGGSTLFSEMNGTFLADANRIQLRQIRLSAGLLNANGSAEVDAQKNLSGRMQIELRAQASQARATLAISGTLAEPQFRRSN